MAAENEEVDPYQGVGEDQRMVRGARSRQKILDTALLILSEEGYGALTIAAICKRSGTSATSIYHHFGGKNGLMKEMVETTLARNVALLTGSVAGMTSPLDRLDAFLAMDREIFLDDTSNCSAVLMALSQARGQAPEMTQILAEARRKMWQVSADEFATHLEVKDGTLHAHILAAFSSYVAMVGKGPDSAADVDALVSSLRTIFLLVAATVRPEYLDDPHYKAAFATISEALKRPA